MLNIWATSGRTYSATCKPDWSISAVYFLNFLAVKSIVNVLRPHTQIQWAGFNRSPTETQIEYKWRLKTQHMGRSLDVLHLVALPSDFKEHTRYLLVCLCVCVRVHSCMLTVGTKSSYLNATIAAFYYGGESPNRHRNVPFIPLDVWTCNMHNYHHYY